jgi:hypothetical protein
MLKSLFNYLKGNIKFMLGVWIFAAIMSIPFFIGIDVFSIENKDEFISYSWYYLITLYVIMFLRFRHIRIILTSAVKALHYFLVWLSMGVMATLVFKIIPIISFGHGLIALPLLLVSPLVILPPVFWLDKNVFSKLLNDSIMDD